MAKPEIPAAKCGFPTGKVLSHLADSNRRPADYESAALPAELRWRWPGAG